MQMTHGVGITRIVTIITVIFFIPKAERSLFSLKILPSRECKIAVCSNCINDSSGLKYPSNYAAATINQPLSLYTVLLYTRRRRPRCCTCFMLYDQSRVAARGPTRFEHFPSFLPDGESDKGTKYISPALALPLSPSLIFHPFCVEGQQMPDGHYIASSTTELRVLRTCQYALSIPIRATLAVGRSSNPAIEWYLT